MKKDEFCKKLKQARVDANFTQSEIAKILSISTSAISMMEAGERKLDIFELFGLLKIYQKDISFFTDESLSKQGKRWYDKDPILAQAIALLEQASPKLQKASAMGLIGFLQEFHSSD